jgi:radical SAM superfamily enzyme YgiQ (UPF0313 family)
MKQNIFLIHPSKKLLGKRDNLYTNESLTPSLGLATIAAYCRQEGFNPKIIDMRLAHWSVDKMLGAIMENEPLFVGITAFTNEITQAAATASRIKSAYQRLPIVIGGPHSSAIPKETLTEFKAFDIAVIGEGEETVVDIAGALSSHDENRLNSMPGIAVRINENIRLNPPRKAIEDIDTLPLPAWDIFEVDYYNKLFVINTSRGCPYGCYFCNPNYLGSKVRVRGVLRVADEIEYVVKNFGAKKIQFGDATLSLLGKRTQMMCDEIIKRGLSRKMEWDCETRADAVNPKLLKKMRDAGCRWIALGVETGSDRILKEVIGKNETKEQMRQAVNIIKASGIKVRCFFILGHYTETIDTIKETIRFSLELNPNALSFGLMVPNPGTQIRVIAQQPDSKLRVLNNRWENYNQFNYDCFELENLPLPQLKEWQSNAYFTFYRHHPIKAFGLFLDNSGYNYELKKIFKILAMLLRNLFKKDKHRL